MIKKKSSIYLLLLLAVLFISLLSTTSYAKTLTRQEIINFIYNGYEYFNSSEPDSTFKDRIENIDFSSWIAASDTYEGQWYISFASTTQVHFGYYYGSATNMNLYGPYIYNNGIYVNTSYLTRKRSQLSLSTFTIATFGNNNTNLHTGDYFFYTDTNLYSTSAIADATVIYPAGYESMNNIFGGGNRVSFIYAPSSLIPNINLNGSYNFSETAQEVLFVYNSFESGNPVNQADSVITGYLFDADIFSKAVFTEYAYNYATGKFEYDGRYWETSDIGDVDNNKILVEFLAQNYGVLYKPDTILHAEFQSNTTDFDFVHADFYIRSPHSKIINDVLYPRRNI